MEQIAALYGFSQPWALLALLFLPALWLLLRLTPPQPKRQSFPPLDLLTQLTARRIDPARSPWWVIALRLALALCVVLAAAAPVLNPVASGASSGPLAVIVDDGWAAARMWRQRLDAAEKVVQTADRAQRSIILLTTAPAQDGTPPHRQGPMSADQALQILRASTPKPWNIDRDAALRALQDFSHDQVIQVEWFADGLDDSQGKTGDFARALQSLGGGVRLHQAKPSHVLSLAQTASDRPVVRLRRFDRIMAAETLNIRALDDKDRVIGRAQAAFADGKDATETELTLPAELRNRIVRLDLQGEGEGEGEAGAAQTLLLDQSWTRRVVGMVGAPQIASPLLSPAYYVERALAPHASILHGDSADLAARRPDVIIAIDPSAADAESVADWVESGGVLIRIAGPIMAAALGESDALLPVPLRPGGRNLGGAMSWTSPQGLAPFPEPSPFFGLPITAEVQVSAQVLAEPMPDLAQHVWAALADGTPLITAARRGRGWTVLVHTGGKMDWTNLPLSGLWVDLLRRMTALSHHAGPLDQPLAPGLVLDGFGRLSPPAPNTKALPRISEQAQIGPDLPPGLYGPAGGRIAFNLGPRINEFTLFTPPSGIATVQIGDSDSNAIDLRGPLWAVILVLLLLDLAASMRLRGLALTGLAAALIAFAQPSQADPAFDLEAGLSTRPAYVRTGLAAIDAKSRSGLDALARTVSARSTARMGPAMAVDLERDPVLFFPFVYWPLIAGTPQLSAQAAAKLNAYMRAGGLLVLDTGDQSETARDPAAMGDMVQGLNIGPLVQIGADHVLTRTFFLLKELPGRWNGAVWAAAGGADGVAPVIVSGNDWAGAWASDAAGRPNFACVPGGERQREIAFRFGVNLAMYALTGNYKADQVHLPAILERLGR